MIIVFLVNIGNNTKTHSSWNKANVGMWIEPTCSIFSIVNISADFQFKASLIQTLSAVSILQSIDSKPQF